MTSQKVETLDGLGDTMKAYEAVHEHSIPPTDSYLIRCDGKNFSTFTNGFHLPFDPNFKQAMVSSVEDTIVKFHFNFGYCHSDEATFCKAPVLEDTGHSLNGRVCKILTVVSSYFTVRFNFHIMRLVNLSADIYDQKFVDKINNMTAHFDGRILSFSSDKQEDIARHMIWRSLRDCRRNAISTYARKYYSSKALNGKHSNDMIIMMKAVGFDFNSVPQDEVFGMYSKKMLIEVENVNKKTGKPELSKRCKVVSKSLIANRSPEFLELLISKYWPEEK
jgi:tRNA(His) 5'-end guanylyltransferase